MTEPYYADESVTLYHGDALAVLQQLPDASVDAVVTDPPYGLTNRTPDVFGCEQCGRTLGGRDGTPDACPRCGGHLSRQRSRQGRGFMGKEWDATGIAFRVDLWAEALRVLKPGGHLLAFGGTRTVHRLTCAIEDAGFEIRDGIDWIYGAGFPKSLNVNKDERFCQCDLREWSYGDGGLRGMRQGLPDVSPDAAASEVPDLFAAVQREGARSGVGDAWGQGPGGLDGSGPRVVPGEDERRAEPGVEGRGDAQAGEGQLRRAGVRPMPGGVPGDGAGGRVRDGAPAGDGSTYRPSATADRGGQSHRPQPAEQRPGEPGVVAGQRLTQAGRGWPVCGRCGKPSIPAGLGTALKPAREPIVVARKPLQGTVAANVLQHGTGALNIDATRVPGPPSVGGSRRSNFLGFINDDGYEPPNMEIDRSMAAGRWPANVVLSHAGNDVDGDLCADGCVEGCPVAELDQQSGASVSRVGKPRGAAPGDGWGMTATGAEYDDSGGASRYFPTFRYGPSDLLFFPAESEAWLGNGSTRDASTSAGRKTESSDDNSPTDGSGSRPTARSPTGTRSTTGTTTPSTTTSPTSCASPQSGTTTTTTGSVSSTAGLMESSSASASDAVSGSPSPATTSGGPEPGRATASRASGSTGASGSAADGTSSTPSAGRGAGQGSTPDRFFPVFRYEAKADANERPRVNGVAHPTVKPLAFMRWMVRLVTPPGGVVLDPFAGSGTTAEACTVEGFRCVLVEREADYLPLIVARLSKPLQPVLFGEVS